MAFFITTSLFLYSSAFVLGVVRLQEPFVSLRQVAIVPGIEGVCDLAHWTEEGLWLRALYARFTVCLRGLFPPGQGPYDRLALVRFRSPPLRLGRDLAGLLHGGGCRVFSVYLKIVRVTRVPQDIQDIQPEAPSAEGPSEFLFRSPPTRLQFL